MRSPSSGSISALALRTNALGFLRRGAARAQMHVNLARDRQNRGREIRIASCTPAKSTDPDPIPPCPPRAASASESPAAAAAFPSRGRHCPRTSASVPWAGRAAASAPRRRCTIHWPGAVPRSLGSTSAPSTDVSLAPIDLRHLAAEVAQARFDAIANVLLKNRACGRSAEATASRVRSSSVGPKPPVSTTICDRAIAPRMLSVSRSRSSPTTVLRTTSTPSALS